LIGQRDALGQVSRYEWDAAGRLLALTEPDGGRHAYQWSPEGRLLAYTDPLGVVTRWLYDSHGDPIKRIDANGHRLRYIYDAVGRLVCLIPEMFLRMSILVYRLRQWPQKLPSGRCGMVGVSLSPIDSAYSEQPLAGFLEREGVLEHDERFAQVAKESGFSLHAGVAAQAWERSKLERLCRYITSPAVSKKRLSVTGSGNIRYELKRLYSGGTTHVIFEPLDLSPNWLPWYPSRG
jgi:YD repeat-containing protein